MIQANDFISKLRLEPDSVLKQMADMHQNDPYLFPMIFQESQARKDARAQAQAQQMGQQPLTTKEQDLQQIAALDQSQPQMNQPAPPAGNMPQAPNTPSGMPLQGPGSGAQMLPEEQGIGALPAKNMQHLAGGGITGENHFGGGIPREKMLEIVRDTNAQLPKPIEEMTPQEIDAWMIQNSPNAKPYIPTSTLNFDSTPTGSLPRGQANANKQLNAVGDYFGNTNTSSQRNPQAQVLTPEVVASSPGITSLLGQNQPTSAQATADLNFAKNNNVDTGSTDTGANNNKAPWSPGIVAPQVSAAGVALGPKPTAAGSMRDASTFYNPAGIQNLLQENVTERGVLNTQNAVALDNMIKARPNLGGDYEKRLKEQEAKAPEEKENLKGMSLLEAGLAIMGGDSPYAAQNIARGVAGVKSYKEGLKDLQKAQDLRDQAFAHIDDMRKAQTIGDQNLAYTSTVQANDKLMDAKALAVNGFVNALGVSGKMAADLFTSDTNNYGANQRTASTNAVHAAGINAQMQMDANRLNMPPAEARMAMMLGGPTGDLETGLKKLAEIQSGKVNPLQSFLDYQKTNAGKQTPYGEPVKLMDAPEYFAMFDKAVKLYKTSLGPSAPTNTAPSVLRPDK